MKFYLILISLPLLESTAFSVVRSTLQRQTVPRRTTKKPAIIYGWDEGGDESEDEDMSYVGISSAFDSASCPPVGTALAENLSRDENKIGTLARLAVAFSPPERGISIKDIERVQVVCVREDRVELEAILCEDGGCVSLSVPIKFPTECQSDSFEGCVLQNIEELDVEAESTLILVENNEKLSEADFEVLCRLNDKVEYPNWWVPPECDTTLAADCENIRQLLNEDEFQPEIIALADDVLRRTGKARDNIVKRAKVAAVGPAGVCLRVGVTDPITDDLQFLDVMYPFGGDPHKDVESLRAAVLGAIAATEDKRPSHTYQEP